MNSYIPNPQKNPLPAKELGGGGGQVPVYKYDDNQGDDDDYEVLDTFEVKQQIKRETIAKLEEQALLLYGEEPSTMVSQETMATQQQQQISSVGKTNQIDDNYFPSDQIIESATKPARKTVKFDQDQVSESEGSPLGGRPAAE